MATPESFQRDVGRFMTHLTELQRKVVQGTAQQMKQSITDGSAATGAPGQPVDTGYLKNSWQIVAESPTSVLIGTNCAYAPVIEENNRAAYDDRGTKPELEAMHTGRKHIKSTVGGHHSVALTRQNFDRIVRNVIAEMGP